MKLSLIILLISICSCRVGYNSPRGAGWVTSTPIHLIGEIPGEEIPSPYVITYKRKPKDGKDYFLPQYKLITEYTK